MKTFVLIMCLLTVAHALDCEKQKEVISKLKECAVKVPRCNCQPKDFIMYLVDVWFCALSNLETVDKNGMMIKSKAIEFCYIYKDDVIKRCTEIINLCIKEAGKSECHHKTTYEVIKCFLHRGGGDIVTRGEECGIRKHQCDQFDNFYFMPIPYI